MTFKHGTRGVAAAALALAGCTNQADLGENAGPSGPCGAGDFDSTFAAIQKVVFEGYGCTQDLCHGNAKSGGLDLRAGASYRQLIEVKSEGSPLTRILPGQPSESYLFAKLRAAVDPESVAIEGSPMPNGLPPLTADHLEAVRRWIADGAPEAGSVIDPVTRDSAPMARLLGSCLPPATPIEIKPLDAPAPSEGIQFAMPPFALDASSEIEVCFAQYYDFSNLVPAEFQDPARGIFYINGKRTRQDPQSHHLALAHSHLGAESVNDPTFGSWACRGGDSDGQACDPLVLDGCGGGACAAEAVNSIACIGYGPANGQANVATGNIGGGQTAQQYIQPVDGVYEEIPIRGIVYWNSHAFNLTTKDTKLHAWLNLSYTSDLRFKLTQGLVNALGQVVGQPPFTMKHYCADWVAPLNTKIYWMSSHTHKRGTNFTVAGPDGSQIYSSTIYSDPVTLFFTPSMEFNAPDDAARTLTYCADFNNGVKPDGSPDVASVTRSSRMPDRTECTPVACVSGQIGAPCNGADDNATCDSSPDAGDGSCDACPITSGVTTENEMFFFIPGYYAPN